MSRWIFCVALVAACGGGGDGSSGDASAIGDATRPDGSTGADGGTSGARLIVMGDSTSFGLGASSSANSYANLLASSFGLESIAVAVPGSTTEAVATSQLDGVRDTLGATVTGPTIVVLTSGGNDIIQARNNEQDPAGATLDAAIVNLRTMVAFYQDTTRFPDGAAIYLASVVDPTDGTGDAGVDCEAWISGAGIPAVLDDWRDAYAALASELGFTNIDVLGHFRGHGFHYDDAGNPYYDAADPTHWFADCVHPNDVGHAEMRDLFEAAIAPD